MKLIIMPYSYILLKSQPAKLYLIQRDVNKIRKNQMRDVFDEVSVSIYIKQITHCNVMQSAE